MNLNRFPGLSARKPKLSCIASIPKTMKSILLLYFLLVTLEGAYTQAQDTSQSVAAKIKVRTILVNEPVTVRNHDGRMVHNLEPKDFRITDNGLEQTIIHFEVGGDSISLVVLVETSSRIEAEQPDLRKSGSVVSQIVMGPNAETAVVGFNDTVTSFRISPPAGIRSKKHSHT
jgi:hypothetical protein